MARPIRIDVADGVYHVISRGTERGDLFREDADRLHFLDKLTEAQGRFRLCIYAYVLMDNHFHLIVQTPDANLSRAIQWLKVSYSMWFNAKYRRVGPLFQGRFKSVLVDSHENWMLELSYYVHLNPVRVRRLGLDKRGVKLECHGLKSAELAAERLAILREYRWSSYPYYAGYKRRAPDWLSLEPLLSRTPSRAEYRRQAEHRLTEGVELSFVDKMKDRIALGSLDFIERMRRVAPSGQDYEGRVAMHHQYEWRDVVMAVEKVKGQKWSDFAGVRGDWGRACVYYLARKYAGMTLAEVGAASGGVNYPAVSQLVKRFERRLPDNPVLAQALLDSDRMLKIQT